LVERAKRRDKRSAWRLAFYAFSTASSSLTAVSSFFNLVWSCNSTSIGGSLEARPGTGENIVRCPCSEAWCSLLANSNPHSVRVLLLIALMIYTPTFFCKSTPKCSNTGVRRNPYPRSCSRVVFTMRVIWRIIIAGRLI